MNKKDLNRIMKGLCFNSLSYCCGLNKECDNRDSVIKELGLKKEDFIKLKNKLDKNL